MRNDQVKVIILVEGVSDEIFFKQFSKIYSEQSSEIKDLNNRSDVAFIPVGGGNLKHWAERRYLDNLYLNSTYKFCICDGDEGQYIDYYNQILELHSGEIHQLSKATIENYIAPSTIIRHPNYSEIQAITIDGNDAKLGQVLARMLNDVRGTKPWESLKEYEQADKISQTKKQLRKNVLPTMTIDELESIDEEKEIKELLIQISSKL